MSSKLTITITIPTWLDKICAWPVVWYRKHKFGQGFRKIRLTEGKCALVDQQDFYWLNNFDWFAKRNNKSFYAVRFDNECEKWPKMVSMHRQIMGSPEGLLVDHRNLDGLDNQRSNIPHSDKFSKQVQLRKGQDELHFEVSGRKLGQTREILGCICTE